MDTDTRLAARFEEHRAHLRTVAHRMLGSLSEADDAVQETWLRLSRTDEREIRNLRAWLTTVLARICLNALRSRAVRREDPLGPHVPDPVVGPASGPDPEQEALLADAVGLALQVVLGTLNPAERLAFVLHDMFAVPFEEIAPMVGRSPAATRQLASRARRRVRGVATTPDVDLPAQRVVVEAFFAAARAGDVDRLVAVLHPDAVLRSDGGPTRPAASAVVHGARAVAERARSFASPGVVVLPALVNGAAGMVVAAGGRARAVMGFTVADGTIVAIDVLADPDRLAGIDLRAVGIAR
jgi:RNA polymerase sigma factor (sigma-70 family)